jgi:hypothetical protein
MSEQASTELGGLLNVPPGGVAFLPGRLLFSKLGGSHSHNTALATSDQDFICVYAAPTEKVLSLRPPRESVTRKKPDVEAHEVAKFCRLLLKGNPGVIECLFTDRFCLTTGEWRTLQDERQRFLSQRVIKQYLGYGQGQLRRFDAGTRLHTKGGTAGEKWCYHMIRVLQDARRIARGGEPVVFKGGEERALLMRIRSGEMRPHACVNLAQSLIAEVEAAKPWPWPEEGDEEWLNGWLLGIRHAKKTA